MTPWHMGAEATACRLPAPALPTRSPCPTLGRPDAARRLVCCAVPFKPVVERACKARASLPHPASTVGQAVLRSDIRAVVVPARDCVAGFTQRHRVDPVLPRKTVGPSRTASRSLCIARTSIGCVLCHGSRWTRTSFFSVSADMFTRAGNTAVQDRGPRLAQLAASPRPARAARTGATQVDARNPRHSRPAVSLHAIPILRRYDPDQINERRTVTARA